MKWVWMMFRKFNSPYWEGIIIVNHGTIFVRSCFITWEAENLTLTNPGLSRYSSICSSSRAIEEIDFFLVLLWSLGIQKMSITHLQIQDMVFTWAIRLFRRYNFWYHWYIFFSACLNTENNYLTFTNPTFSMYSNISLSFQAYYPDSSRRSMAFQNSFVRWTGQPWNFFGCLFDNNYMDAQ